MVHAGDAMVRDAVAVIAARMAFNVLDQEAAAAFAEACGVVTGATSLVLVDEAGEAMHDLSETRKIALSTPRVHASAAMAAPSGILRESVGARAV